MSQTPSVLIVEDEHALAGALALVCKRLGCEARVASSARTGLFYYREAEPDLVILDVGLPDRSGLEVLDEIRQISPEATVLVITAHGNLENALAARKAGAADYMVKPLALGDFEKTVAGLLAKEPQAQTPDTEREQSQRGAVLIGAAPSMQPVFVQIATACTNRRAILISGEVGTGRTSVAQVIHFNGLHPQGKLLVYRPEDLVGADIFECDPKTTVVVEGLDELDSERQRVVDSALERVREGESNSPRVLATSSAQLPDLVKQGRFHADLYYRLSVFEIRLPALRERLSDLSALCAYFLGDKQRAGGEGLSSAVQDILARYDWPGNLRELRDAMTYAQTLCGGGGISQRHLPPSITSRVAKRVVTESAESPSQQVARTAVELALKAWLDERLSADPLPNYASLSDSLEDMVLQDLLARYQGRPTRLAEALQINRATLRRKLSRTKGSRPE